jgi:hypothetical protein
MLIYLTKFTDQIHVSITEIFPLIHIVGLCWKCMFFLGGVKFYLELRHIDGPLYITQVTGERRICGMSTGKDKPEFLLKKLFRYHFQHYIIWVNQGLNPALRRKDMREVIV